jgi:hypothetical protein
MRPLVAQPDDMLVVAAGGRAGAFSCYIPGWAGGKNVESERDESSKTGGMMARLEILDPTVEPRTQPLTYVPRPDSLKGKRIGLIENTKFNSDKLL